MIPTLIAVPLIVAACVGLFGPAIADRLPPRQATWLVTLGAVVAALSSLAMLGALAAVAVGQWSVVAKEGQWSAASLQANAPIDRWIGLLALGLLAGALASVALVAVRHGHRLIDAYRSCATLGPPGAGHLVVTEGPASAVAVPGRPGRIVVSRSLLSELTAAQRRIVLAHERAHLEHGHHWHLLVVLLASAANPLLRRLRNASQRSVERWADEKAAVEIGDRRQVAVAIARAALMTPERPRLATQHLAMAAHAVAARVEALLGDAPRSRPELTLLPVILLVVAVVATVAFGKDTEHLFEFAGRAYRAAHGL